MDCPLTSENDIENGTYLMAVVTVLMKFTILTVYSIILLSCALTHYTVKQSILELESMCVGCDVSVCTGCFAFVYETLSNV